MFNKIKQIRKQKQLTQVQLAERCNVAQGTIQKLETGEIELNLSWINRLSQALGVRPSEFLPEDFLISPQQLTITDYLEKNKRREKEAAKDILQSFITGACIAVGIFACAFTFYNIYEYNQSFDRCEALLEQINANTAILDQEINELRSQMGEVVDYE